MALHALKCDQAEEWCWQNLGEIPTI